MVQTAASGYILRKKTLVRPPKLKLMKDPLQPKHCAKLLSALAAPERLQIVGCLREGPRTVTEIADFLKAPIVNVSHHLMVLRHAGLVQCERMGRFMVYSLPASVFTQEEDQSSAEHLNLGCCRIEIPKANEKAE
jgi:DNA-binding transcriptional ArsR family regulator